MGSSATLSKSTAKKPMGLSEPESSAPRYVRIINPSLDEENGDIIMRGRIDMATIEAIKIDSTYQRQELKPKIVDDIMNAFLQGQRVPDGILGMRGNKIKDLPDGSCALLDPTFAVDGQQRRAGFMRCMEGGGEPRWGAQIYFDTNRDMERDMFEVYNSKQNKVSPGVLIRNRADTVPFVAMMLAMCEKDIRFPLANKVKWDQYLKVGHVISGTSLVKSIGYMHSHLGVREGRAALGVIYDLQAVYDKIGRNTIRENIRTFYQLVDSCWNINQIELKGAMFLRCTFLNTMCKLISDHDDFWVGDSLVIPKALTKRWMSFPIHDHKVVYLSGVGSKVHPGLYDIMVNHLDKGRRSRLSKRDAVCSTDFLLSSNGNGLVLDD
jgi:hypothetical protein